MSWNNRIVKRKDGWYAVHEVYYNEDGEAHAMTLEPAFRLMVNPDDPISGCGPEEIRDALKTMLRDVEKDLGERGIFEEPEKWADDGYGDDDVAMIDKAIKEIPDITRELAEKIVDQLEASGENPTVEEIETWAKRLAKDIGNATD